MKKLFVNRWLGQLEAVLSISCRVVTINATANNKSRSFYSTRAFGQPSASTHPYLIKEGEVTPRVTKEEYKSRRNAVMEKLSLHWDKRHVAIIMGEAITYMSEDIPYQFHQNTNFLYLTGFLEPDSCLVMEAEGDDMTSCKSTLLVPARDPQKELWHGPRSGVDGALQLTGVDATEEIDKLPDLLKTFLHPDYMVWCDYQKTINLQLFTKHLRPFLKEAFEKDIKVFPVGNVIHKERLIKSEAEVALLAEACDMTSQAFKHVMQVTSPGMNERAIQAMIDCECRLRGAQTLAYPPVVAGGERANTLHYISNNRRLEPGQLVLVDAGAEFHGYAADVTRTWPVSGKFTPEQRRVYEAVHRVQLACIACCRPGTSLDHVYHVMTTLLARELADSDILRHKLDAKDVYQKVRTYCPHHVGHWLGMDVHDTSSVNRALHLEPGTVVTIEPGLYLRWDDDEVSEAYRGIGVRIEDDVLVTETGPRVLSHACPKDADEIEAVMAPPGGDGGSRT